MSTSATPPTSVAQQIVTRENHTSIILRLLTTMPQYRKDIGQTNDFSKCHFSTLNIRDNDAL